MESKSKLPPAKAPSSATTEDMAIDQMSDTPKRGSLHRRAHSDTSFRFPNLDDLLLFDPSDLDLSTLPSPSAVAPSDPSPRSSDDSSSAPLRRNPASLRPVSHVRSLSVDSEFFDGLGLGGGESSAAGEKRILRQNSADGFEAEKKAMAPDRLAELALIDPKRAKRILANRQSAARSKERKIRYTNELERKVQTLQTEATTLSAQVTLLQRDTTGLTTENKELKLRLQAMEQQAELREALNEKLREEVQRLKIATGHIQPANGNPFGRGLNPHFTSGQPIRHSFGTHQTQQQQQQQQQQQHQLHMSQSSSNNGQASRFGFMDFNQRV